MAEKSIKKNIMFSVMNSFITLAFPLITFPYISRVLLPAGIGQYSFINSIISYFLLLSLLGIPLYATKKVAENRNDIDKMRIEASRFFYISLFLSILVSLAYVVFVFIDPKGKDNIALYLIMGIQILSNALSVEWYFSANEKFGYIAIRNLLTKLLCIVLIFVFVNSKDDIIIYACIMILSTASYALINLLKFIKDIKPKFIVKGLSAYLIPILSVFILHIAAKINDSLDSVMLGYMIGEDAVGQYVSATKIINMVVAILLVINTVLLPRIANYISEGKINEAKDLLKKSFALVFALSVPATIGLAFTSKEIILLLSGSMYTEAINTMIIMCVNVFTVVFTNFMGIQVLFAFGYTKSTTVAISSGALLNLILNFILIPKFSHFGAGITTIISNATICAILAVFVFKKCRFNIINKENLKVLISAFIMTGVLIILQVFNIFENNIILSFIIKVLSAGFVYLLMLIILKHTYVLQMMKSIFSKFKSKKKIAFNNDMKDN